MRIYLIFLCCLFMSVSVSARSYICPMHPHISGENGETCPICGMTLVENEVEFADGAGEALVQIPSLMLRRIGGETVSVTKQDFGGNVRSYGVIERDESLRRVIDLRTSGWIRDLKSRVVGDVVESGDVLFDIYSPDLMTVQADYLIGRQIGNAERRLRFYGMDDRSIRLLNKKGDFLDQTPIYSPASGVITKIEVAEGSFVQEGGRVMVIDDFSHLWAIAEISFQDARSLKKGQDAHLVIGDTGQEIASVIDYIYPVLDPRSHTVKVRVLVDNETGILKKGMYAVFFFEGEVTQRLSVPQEAVIWDSQGAYVFVQKEVGFFQPRRVQIGVRGREFVEIIHGLKENEDVVRRGQFMIDAEYQLRHGQQDTVNIGGNHVH